MAEGTRPVPAFPRLSRPRGRAIVLAGGRSRRMGADKRFLLKDGRTWLEQAVRLAAAATGQPLDEVWISGETPQGTGVPDLRPVLGPLEGIRSVIAHYHLRLNEGEPLLVLAVDQPL